VNDISSSGWRRSRRMSQTTYRRHTSTRSLKAALDSLRIPPTTVMLFAVHYLYLHSLSGVSKGV
jgi:hypothetical protein